MIAVTEDVADVEDKTLPEGEDLPSRTRSISAFASGLRGAVFLRTVTPGDIGLHRMRFMGDAKGEDSKSEDEEAPGDGDLYRLLTGEEGIDMV